LSRPWLCMIVHDIRKLSRHWKVVPFEICGSCPAFDSRLRRR
jgi:hypothetical protein